MGRVEDVGIAVDVAEVIASAGLAEIDERSSIITIFKSQGLSKEGKQSSWETPNGQKSDIFLPEKGCVTKNLNTFIYLMIDSCINV